MLRDKRVVLILRLSGMNTIWVFGDKADLDTVSLPKSNGLLGPFGTNVTA